MMPFRFFTKVGEEREIIILDVALGQSFYEHALQNPRTGFWDTYESCPKEWENCDLCIGSGPLKGKESYYVMMLSIIDLTPFVAKKGTPEEKTVQFGRKLLAVKAGQHGFFLRLLERHKTLRGIHLLQTRDTKDSPSIGMSEFLQIHDEAAIIESFGGPAIVDSQGKTIKEANADAHAFNYGMLFRKPSNAEIALRHNFAPRPGSRQEANNAWGEPSSSAASSTGSATRIAPRGAITSRALSGGAEHFHAGHSHAGHSHGGDTQDNPPSNDGSTEHDIDDEIPF